MSNLSIPTKVMAVALTTAVLNSPLVLLPETQEIRVLRDLTLRPDLILPTSNGARGFTARPVPGAIMDAEVLMAVSIEAT